MSTVEMIFYIPLLMGVVFLAVQMSLYYLGDQVASSTAREAARIIRTGGTAAAAQTAATAYAHQIGNGIVSNVQVTEETPSVPGNTRVRVTATPLTLITMAKFSQVSATSEGPREFFRPDTGP